jgi:hypothetical protein
MFYILKPNNTLCFKTHCLKIPYDEQMDPYLYKLELYQMAIMRDYQMDKSLITARWQWRWKMFVIYGDWLFVIFYYFYILIFNYSLKFRNLLKYEEYRRTNNQDHWWRLEWDAEALTVLFTSNNLMVASPWAKRQFMWLLGNHWKSLIIQDTKQEKTKRVPSDLDL